MKKIYILLFSFAALFLSITKSNAQGTETFEAPLPVNSTSFTRAGLTFTSSSANFDTDEFLGAGAGGSDRYIDNIDAPATNSTYSISITGGATLFTMQSMEVYVSSIATGDNPTADGTMTFRGFDGATQVFTSTKTTGFPTTFGSTQGFFLLDFTALPVFGDASSINIDRLEVSINGAFQYFAIDNFEFDNEVLEADPPEVQSITVVGTPASTAPSVDFLVTFNENANNVSTDDFALDAVGTFGTIASVSAASGTTITVTVNGISGEGTISIDLNGGTNIADDLGNTPPPAFSAGQNHFVSRCFQETFESYTPGDFMFATNGVTYTTGTANFDVENFGGGGAGGSDQFLSNLSDQGTGKIYSITTSGPELFTIEAVDFYLSSQANGTNPTNDGTLTIEGRLTGSTLYTIQKTTGFPTNFTINNGFYTVDFATEGASDYSLTNIDELRVTIGGAFIYIALDNFEHCEEITAAAPPIVQSIKLIGNPPANSASVNFEVIFNENANLVSTDDFSLNLQGTAVGTIASLSGSGNTYNVLVNAISGEGSFRLDLNSGTDIEDDSGNTPPDPFTEGERFIVSICDVETYEGLADGTFSWTTNTVPWASQGAGFSVDEFIGAGAGGSDRYIDNVTSQGTGDINTIAITDTQMVKMGSMEIYVSSILNGDNPTNDGTLTVRGKLDGTTLYTVTKSTGFPTVFGSTQGFYLWDFATEGGTDHSMTDVDEIELGLGGAFQYLAVDNFKFCMDPPDETEVALAGGALTITDINGGTSDDNITLSVVGPNLRITNTVARFLISGAGVVEVDDNTVDVLLANITNGVTVDAISGNDAISITTALNLPGAANGLTIQNFDSFSQTPGSDITMGGDITYNIGGSIDFRNTTVGGNLSVTTVGNMANFGGTALNITGTTTLNSGAANIQLGGNHNFVGLINATGNIVSMSGTPPAIWNLNDITATSTIGFTNNAHGLTFNGVISGPGLVQLRGGGTEGLLQVAGTIAADLLEMAAGGQNIDVSLPGNDANLLRLYDTNNATFVDVDDIDFADVNVNNVTITAPTINFGGGSLVALNSGASNFNGDVTSVAGSIFNHNGGTVDFNGTSINLSSLQYNGAGGTTTNMNGGLITAGSALTFQDLNVNSGDYQTNNVITTVNGIAIFSGTANLIGTGSISGEVVIGTGGELAAGNSPGCLSTGNLTLLGGSTSTFEVTGITPCTLHDQVQVTGTVTIDPAANIAFLVGYANTPADEIILFLNDGVEAISGTFNGYPEGASVSFGAFVGNISYVGGDGNDLALIGDNTPPVVTCPADITQNNDPGDCGAVVTFTVTATDNNPGVTLVVNPPSGSTFPIGTTIVTATATDAAGNTATCSFNVTVNDVEDPTITCPADITVNNDPGVCGAIVNYTDPTVSDNCPIGVTTATFNYTGSAQFFTVPSGVTSINIEAWGASGQSVTAEQYTPSTGGLGGYATGDLAVTPGDIILLHVGGTGNDGFGGYNGGAIGGFGTGGGGGVSGFAGSGGGASDVRLSGGTLGDRVLVAGGGGGGGRDYVNGTCQPCGQGGNGGAGGGATGVDGQDPTDPIYGTYFNPGAGGKGGTQASGGLGGNGPQGPDGNPGSQGNGGIGIDGLYTMASGGGGGGYFGGGSGAGANTGSGAAGGGGAGGSSYIGGVTSGSTNNGVRSGNGEIIISWGSGGSVTQTAGLASGSVFPVGTTTNTFEVIDASGNSASCSFTVTVVDNEAPQITCPADITVNNDPGICGAVVSWTAPIPTDNCSGTTVSNSNNPGDTFPVGSTTVTYTATDASGNMTSCSFTVTVLDVEDPSITCPGDITVNNDPGLCGAVVTFSPTATDNCPGVTIVSSPPSGSTFPVGTTTVTVTATDAGGSSPITSSANTAILALGNGNDGEAIAFNPVDGLMYHASGISPGSQYFEPIDLGTLTVGANLAPSNTWPGGLTQEVTGMVWYPPFNGFVVMDRSNNIALVNPATANFSLLSTFAGSGSFGYIRGFAVVGTNIYGVEPGSGNLVEFNPNTGAVVNTVPVVIDGTPITSGSVGLTTDPVTGDVYIVYKSGGPNRSLGIIDVTTGIGTGIGVIGVNYAGLSFDTSGNLYGVSGDGASPASTLFVFDESTIGAGNSATCTFNVTVIDVDDPVITCPADITVNNDLGVCEASVTVPAPTFTDNCAYAGCYRNDDIEAYSLGLILGQDPNWETWTPGTASESGEVSTDQAQSGTQSVKITGVPTGGPVDQTYRLGELVAGVWEITYSMFVPAGNTAYTNIQKSEVSGIEWANEIQYNSDGSAQYNANNTFTTFAYPQNVWFEVKHYIDLTNDINEFFINGTSIISHPYVAGANGTGTLGTIGSIDFFPVTNGFGANSTEPNPSAIPLYYVDDISLCAIPINDYNNTADASDVYPVGATNVVWTVTDPSGNNASCTQVITVNDNEVPVVTCPADITVSNDPGDCGAIVNFTPTVTDNCPGSTVTTVPASGSFFPIGTTLVTATAIDASGNMSSCTFNVIVNDAEPPVITCPGNITVDNDPGICGAIITFTAPTGTDNCPGATTVQTQGLASGSEFPVGTTTNTFVVTDASGNTASCSFNVTVIDAEDPTITCPGNITVDNDLGVCGAVVNYTVTESDNCSTAVNQIPDQTGTFSGNARGYWFTAPVDFVMTGLRVPTTASSADQNVMVMRFDVVPPNFAATGPYAELLHWSGQVPGNGFIPVNISISAGDIIGILGTRGTNTNSYTTGTNMVIAGINVPIDRLLTQNSINSAPAPQGSFSTEVGSPNQSRVEFEYVTPITVQTAGLPSGSVFPIGTTTNTFVTTDGAGNTATCSFDVTVNDTELPIITCPANISVNNDPGVCGAIVTYPAPTTSDNCPGETISQTEGLPSGSTFPVGTTTNTFVVTDASGNTASCSFTVTVTDNEPPVANCAAPFTVQLDASGNATITVGDIDNGSTDNCGIASMSIDPSSFTCADVGPNTVTLTVTDVNGNTSTCTTIVTVEDNVAPIAVCQNITIDLDPDGNATITPADVDGGSSDACGIANLSIDIDTFDCSNVGPNNVVLTVTDVNGNTSQCTAVVTVQDVTAPFIACPADIVTVAEPDICGIVLTYADPFASDACGVTSVVLTNGLPSGSVFPVGVTTVEWTATDVNGNSATCSFTVTVTDITPPVVVCQDITIALDASGNATITVADVDGGTFDNCALDTLTIDIDTFDCSNVGPNNVTLTATDIYGNTSTCVAVVTVEDVTAPIAICQNITVQLDATGTVTINPADLDGGSTDACGIDTAAYSVDIDTFDCSNVGDNTVVLTVTDVNGNTSTCTAIVTVEDTSTPDLVCQDITVELDENGLASIVPEDVIASNTDVCGIFETSVDISDFDCDDIGTPVTVTIFSEDVNSNISSCTATVTVIDLLPPVVTCPADQTVDPGGPTDLYEVPDYLATGEATAVDNCTDPLTITTQVPAPGTLLGEGTYTVTITAEDESGNIGTCTFELIVDSTLGTNDTVFDISTIVMYPNPAQAVVNISNPQAIPLDNATIYDVTGRLVKTFDLRNMGTEKTLDVSTLASATYVVIIQSESGTITKQLIKE